MSLVTELLNVLQRGQLIARSAGHSRLLPWSGVEYRAPHLPYTGSLDRFTARDAFLSIRPSWGIRVDAVGAPKGLHHRDGLADPETSAAHLKERFS